MGPMTNARGLRPSKVETPSFWDLLRQPESQHIPSALA